MRKVYFGGYIDVIIRFLARKMVGCAVLLILFYIDMKSCYRTTKSGVPIHLLSLRMIKVRIRFK